MIWLRCNLCDNVIYGVWWCPCDVMLFMWCEEDVIYAMWRVCYLRDVIMLSMRRHDVINVMWWCYLCDVMSKLSVIKAKTSFLSSFQTDVLYVMFWMYVIGIFLFGRTELFMWCFCEDGRRLLIYCYAMFSQSTYFENVFFFFLNHMEIKVRFFFHCYCFFCFFCLLIYFFIYLFMFILCLFVIRLAIYSLFLFIYLWIYLLLLRSWISW